MALVTNGFRNRTKLLLHFSDHAVDFGAANPTDYEALADTFLTVPLDADTEECIRLRDNAVIRFNKVTEHYGILSSDGLLELITYLTLQYTVWLVTTIIF